MTDRSQLPSHLREHVRAVVDAFPPLSDDQRARLAALLRPAPEPAVPQQQRAA